jgi:L-ornithine N5-oxygenase
VNEIFDPDRVDGMYNTPAAVRAAQIALDKGTNYGVVRLNLIEHLYDQQYLQRIRESDSSKWRCQILNKRSVLAATNSKSGSIILSLGVYPEEEGAPNSEEDLEVDYVFVATGYKRNAHEDILVDARGLLTEDLEKEGKFAVERNYRVKFDETKVDKSAAGVWLQGCNEGTHGVSFPPTSSPPCHFPLQKVGV